MGQTASAPYSGGKQICQLPCSHFYFLCLLLWLLLTPTMLPMVVMVDMVLAMDMGMPITRLFARLSMTLL